MGEVEGRTLTRAIAETCTLCDFRVAVVAAHRLGDVALHVTRTRPLGDDARCLECVLNDLTRLVVQVNL